MLKMRSLEMILHRMVTLKTAKRNLTSLDFQLSFLAQSSINDRINAIASLGMPLASVKQGVVVATCLTLQPLIPGKVEATASNEAAPARETQQKIEAWTKRITKTSLAGGAKICHPDRKKRKKTNAHHHHGRPVAPRGTLLTH